MSVDNKIKKPNPEPGEILQSLKQRVSDTSASSVPELPSVSTLDEQKRIADKKLDFFLSNISDSPSSRKVVEQFYDEEHDKRIDASNVSELKNEIPDIDSILYEKKLPVVNKEDLRDHFGVGTHSETDPLSPDWVSEDEGTVYKRVESSGTTGPEWKRVLTKNDWGMTIINLLRHLNRHLEATEVELSNSNVVLIAPRVNLGTQACYDGLRLMDINVKLPNLSKLKSGGEESIEEVQQIIRYLEENRNGIVISSLEQIMSGGLGVAIRRGEIDADMYMNMGKPVSEEYRKEFESKGYVGDIYGETEYPQAGAFDRELGGKEGFYLPFESQINLIYDEDTEGLSYEGTGRFAYLPFGSEGQVIPGVYISGVEATIKKVGDKHQLLMDVKRVTDPDRGCYSYIR